MVLFFSSTVNDLFFPLRRLLLPPPFSFSRSFCFFLFSFVSGFCPTMRPVSAERSFVLSFRSRDSRHLPPYLLDWNSRRRSSPARQCGRLTCTEKERDRQTRIGLLVNCRWHVVLIFVINLKTRIVQQRGFYQNGRKVTRPWVCLILCHAVPRNYYIAPLPSCRSCRFRSTFSLKKLTTHDDCYLCFVFCFVFTGGEEKRTYGK